LHFNQNVENLVLVKHKLNLFKLKHFFLFCFCFVFCFFTQILTTILGHLPNICKKKFIYILRLFDNKHCTFCFAINKYYNLNFKDILFWISCSYLFFSSCSFYLHRQIYKTIQKRDAGLFTYTPTHLVLAILHSNMSYRIVFIGHV